MEKKPKFKFAISFIKKDCEDFDREIITKTLNLKPTKNLPPRMSRGTLRCKSKKAAEDEGWTLIESENQTYKMILHASWIFFSRTISSFSLGDAFDKFILNFKGNEQKLKTICEENNLSVSIDVIITTTEDSLPELYLSSEHIFYLSDINASFGYSFYFD